MSNFGSGRSGSIAFPVWKGHHSTGSLTFRVRPAQHHDLSAMSEVLASSFHRQDGLMGWFYPFLRLGIQEDLRSRLRIGEPNHLCLVAIENRSISGSCSSELSWASHSGTLSSTETVAGTVELGLRSPSLWQCYSPIYGRRYLYISNLAVRATYRRQGVARHLLLACEQVARNWGSSELFLHVLESNRAARTLYETLDYQVEQAQKGIDFWLWGQSKQLLLRKNLSSTEAA